MYSFCKSDAESGRRWHIRKLDERGYVFNGGVTTPSLCETLKAGTGYDVSIPVTKDELIWCCSDCAKLYKATVNTSR